MSFLTPIGRLFPTRQEIKSSDVAHIDAQFCVFHDVAFEEGKLLVCAAFSNVFS